MILSRIHINPRSKAARIDLSNPYQMHSTLCRAFCPPERKCEPGTFLWRLEPEMGRRGTARVLAQSDKVPDWSAITAEHWLAEADQPIDLEAKLRISKIQKGETFWFRLRANPCVTREGKRLGLHKTIEQEEWLVRKGKALGFELPVSSFSDSDQQRIAVRISQEQMLRAKKRSGGDISVYSVLFDGVLKVTDADSFRRAMRTGIGHGKFLGLGMLSVIPGG